MKSNIEALQLSLANKKKTSKSINHRPVEPIAIYDHMQSFESRTKSPLNYQTEHNDFDYNSTLFKQIGNDSQPIMNNGSGVSNFSSVSNINQLLNGHNLQQQLYSPPQPQHGDKLLDDIDKILSKVQKNHTIPNKVI